MSTTTSTRVPYTAPYTAEERETYAVEYGRKQFTIWADHRWSGTITATYRCIRRGAYTVVDHRECDKTHRNCRSIDEGFKSLKHARDYARSIG